MLVDPPPLRSEDRSAAEPARRRVIKRKQLTLSIPRLSKPKVQRARSKPKPLAEQPILSNDDAGAEIDLNDPCADLNIGQDIYKWAVVYENQRGCAFAFFTSK